MGTTLTFRTASSRVLCIGAAALAVLIIGAMAVTGQWRDVARSGPVVLCAVALVWAMFWVPRAIVSDGGITIVNPLRTVHVPWPRFTGADSRWSLRVTAGEKTYTSWAVPAASGTAKRWRRGPRDRHSAEDAAGGTTAEEAVQSIEDRLAQLRRAGHLSGSTLGRVDPEITWNRTTVMVLGGCLALAALTHLVT